MRVAIIADIHSNLSAFEAVVADFGGVDEVWCLGDVVGYGPDPNECIRLLRRFPQVCVAGNHDWAAVGKLSAEDFNPDARAAAAWTSTQLSAGSWQFLRTLPTRLDRERCTLVHGSPRDPIGEYVLLAWQAAGCLADIATRCCLVGHSHVPLLFEETSSGVQYVDPDYTAPQYLDTSRWVINPGSVGQPRDGNPDASYVLLETGARRLEFRRVPYDVAATQARMKAAGLPPRLWQRLSYGL